MENSRQEGKWVTGEDAVRLQQCKELFDKSMLSLADTYEQMRINRSEHWNITKILQGQTKKRQEAMKGYQQMQEMDGFPPQTVARSTERQIITRYYVKLHRPSQLGRRRLGGV